MKKLFLVDAYALIYKYYYAFLTRPMRNRTGMNTSVVFGFVKFLRDILKRENPDLLGVAFDPKGGSFRRELYPEYKANRPATPEDIALSIPYIKRILDAMCVPVLEVEGFEADDVIGTLSQKAAAEGYEVFMVTPDKDYGQLVRPCCKLYKQKGDGIEIVDCDAIRAHYGFDDPTLVRDVLALWGDASDNIPGVPGIGEKGACKLVQTWGTVENILSNVERIKGRQGESIAAWGDKLLLAKRLTTIRLDVPIEFRPEELTMCPPNLDELRALFAELDFTMFLRDLQNVAPLEESDGPRQDPQRQLAEMARAKSAAAKKAALVGQGDLFAPADPAPAAAAPVADDEEVDETDALPAEPEMESAQTTPHDYRIVRTADELRAMIAEIRRYPEFCFDTETTGFDLFNDRIVGMSFAVVPHEDDDLNLLSGVTGQFTDAGSEVYVVFVSTGDAAGLGEKRVYEAINALSLDGVPEENIIFLGYGDSIPDDGIHIYNAAPNAVTPSLSGRTETHAAPNHKAYREGTPYTRENLLGDLRSVIEEIRADAGLDIGGTLIGMHLKKVAVPVRLKQDHIGQAIVLAARVRPKFIGGERAIYNEELKNGYPDFDAE